MQRWKIRQKKYGWNKCQWPKWGGNGGILEQKAWKALTGFTSMDFVGQIFMRPKSEISSIKEMYLGLFRWNHKANWCFSSGEKQHCFLWPKKKDILTNSVHMTLWFKHIMFLTKRYIFEIYRVSTTSQHNKNSFTHRQDHLLWGVTGLNEISTPKHWPTDWVVIKSSLFRCCQMNSMIPWKKNINKRWRVTSIQPGDYVWKTYARAHEL